MLIYGKEVDFKISRLSNATAMEMALKAMERDEDKLREMPKDAGAAKVIGAGLAMFRHFFQNACGVDVLEGCDDLEDASREYYAFLDGIKAQKSTMLAPYSPDKIE